MVGVTNHFAILGLSHLTSFGAVRRWLCSSEVVVLLAER